MNWGSVGILKSITLDCLNHVINLAVQDFLKSIKGLASLDEELERSQ